MAQIRSLQSRREGQWRYMLSHQDRMVEKMARLEGKLKEMHGRCLGGRLLTVREGEKRENGVRVGKKAWDGVKWVWRENGARNEG